MGEGGKIQSSEPGAPEQRNWLELLCRRGRGPEPLGVEAPVRRNLESFGAAAWAGANEEACSSRPSANERLLLHRSVETRVELYQSTSPN